MFVIEIKTFPSTHGNFAKGYFHQDPLINFHYFDKGYSDEPRLMHCPYLDSNIVVIKLSYKLRNYQRVIKIHLTTTINLGIHAIVWKLELVFCHSANLKICDAFP